MWGTVPLGSCFGIPVRLHRELFPLPFLTAGVLWDVSLKRQSISESFGALAVLFLATLVLAVISQAFIDGYRVLWAIILFGPVLLFTVYIHELGHCFATQQVRLPPAFHRTFISSKLYHDQHTCFRIANTCAQVGAEVHSILLWAPGRPRVCGA